MNLTRDVMNDLLPVYFSGEASEDTRALMEEYFRENPEFERMARGAAKPLDALRGMTTVAPEAEREKRDLECVRGKVRQKKMFFSMALLFTLAPLAFVYSKGHFQWLIREDPWEAVVFWSFAAVLWLAYFGRLERRTTSLLIAILFIVIPIPLDLHLRFLFEVTLLWSVAALLLIQYFARLRLRTAQTVLAILFTVLPLPFMLHAVIAGGPHVASHVAQPAVVWFFAAWIWVTLFRRRRKTDAESSCDEERAEETMIHSRKR